MEVFGGMSVLRRIAAPYVTAAQAQAKMYPFVAGFYTFVTNVVPGGKICRLL